MTNPALILLALAMLNGAGSAQQRTYAEVRQVLLACRGTVALIQRGKQVNPIDEKYSIAVAVDTARRIVTINDVQWPFFGEASGETIVSMDPNKGSLTLNRITGVISAHFIEFNGLKTFYGECKPAEKLF
jgi:hypothetical protein